MTSAGALGPESYERRRMVVVVPPFPAKIGHAKCPVCRNNTTITSRGYLRKHKDLFRDDCYNRQVSF